MRGPPRQRGLWWYALGCLALAGAVFIVVYAGCNRFTATRGDIGTIFFEWERSIPFVPWMVIPYWSLDLFFCGAFFLCRSRAELRLLTLRLIVVVLASGACFLLFPLRFGWARPEPSGWTAIFFRALYANDMPYNLAPSLHISLRSLVWIVYGAHLRGRVRAVTKIWFILIGLSTMLVWQHHIMDVATGFLMGWVIQAILPASPSRRGPITAAHRRLALRTGLGAAACGGLAMLGGGWLWFGWTAVALGIVTLAYLRADARLLGKENGTFSPAAEWCLMPWLIVAWFIQRNWLRREPPAREIAPGIWFGRRHALRESSALLAQGPVAVLDLTAESNASPAFREAAVYRNVPLLDLVPPSASAVRDALAFIREHHGRRKVIIHCQLGLLRSATIAAAWLVESGAVADYSAAVAAVRQIEPAACPPEALV